MRSRVIPLLCLLVCWSLWGQSQQPPNQPNRPTQPTLPGRVQQGGRVSGRVLPARGERELPEMLTIKLAALYGGFERVEMVSSGHFEFENVPWGRYRLILENPDYKPVEQVIQLDPTLNTRQFVLLTLGDRIQQDPKLPRGQPVVRADSLTVPEKAWRELEKANEQSARNRPEKALQHLEKALKIHPDFFEAHHNKAVQYLKLNRHQEAIASLQRCAEIRPDDAAVYRYLGMIYAMIEEPDQALHALRKAAQMDSRHVSTWLQLGNLYMNQGQFILAAKNFHQALQLDPHNSSALLGLGYAQLELHLYPQALEQFNRFLGEDPSHPRAERIRKLVAQIRKDQQ